MSALVAATGACSVSGRATTADDTTPPVEAPPSTTTTTAAPALLSATDADTVARQVKKDLCDLGQQGFTPAHDRGDPPADLLAMMSAYLPSHIPVARARFYQGAWSYHGAPADSAFVFDHFMSRGGRRTAILLRSEGASFTRLTNISIDTAACPGP